MSSSSKSSRAGYASSKSSDESRGRHSRGSKSRSNHVLPCDDEIVIPFHRLDSPDPSDDQQQRPHTIAFKATLSSAFVAAPVQLTESSSLSCATSTADSAENTDSFRSYLPTKQRPSARVKPQSHERDGDPHGLFESFVNQRGSRDTEWNGASSNSPRPRPNSANSIVNVMKIVTTHTAEATQLIQKHFSICGRSTENETHTVEDLRIPFKSMTVAGKASPKHANDPMIVHESIEYPFTPSVEALDENSKSESDHYQRSSIPFQHSSGSAFGRVGSTCSLQSISGKHSDFDSTVSVSHLRSSRGGPSLFLSSSASDVSSSCSGASTSFPKNDYQTTSSSSSQRGDSNLSSISARAQLSIKNKRRQKRQRDSKSRSSFESTEANHMNTDVPMTELSSSTHGPQSVAPLSSVDEEYTHHSMESHDIEPFGKALSSPEDPSNGPLEESYEMVTESNLGSLPVYYKLEDDDQGGVVKPSRSNRVPNRKKTCATPRRHEAVVLPLPHHQSPNSMDGSQSPITVKSLNTSVQSINSYLSVGSSVIEADREVMEVNRSRLRQSKMGGDVDSSMSIHSSDSVSTHAYATLTNGSYQREGASLRVDQFFHDENYTMENRRMNHDSCSHSTANKSFSSDESPSFVSIHPHRRGRSNPYIRRPSEDDYDEVVSYSKLGSSEDKQVFVVPPYSHEKNSRYRHSAPKAELSPMSDVGISSPSTLSPIPVSSGDRDVALSNPVSPPSRFFDSHPPDYLHQKKPSVVRRYNFAVDPSLREKIDFFSRISSSDVSLVPICTKTRVTQHGCSSKAAATVKVVGQVSSHDATPHLTEPLSDPCALISPDK